MNVTTPEIKTRRRMLAIMRILNNAESSMGSERIAQSLELAGVVISERAVRNYLAQTDTLGWTVNLGRLGRKITDRGRAELERALVLDKVGFIAARVDALSYQMNFDIASLTGKIILNISTVSLRESRSALRILSQIFKARLGMGRLVAIAGPGESLGTFVAPPGTLAIGTVCSVSLNGILLRANIATTSRFGGLVEMDKGKPARFTQIINYDGSSLDPLEIFIRSHMTSLLSASRTGSGTLGASFREIPAVAFPEVQRLIKLSEQAGLGGVLAIGSADQPLLDIPVAVGRVGMIVCGGLNPIAAVVESGITVTSAAMSTLCDYSRLQDYRSLA